MFRERVNRNDFSEMILPDAEHRGILCHPRLDWGSSLDSRPPSREAGFHGNDNRSAQSIGELDPDWISLCS